MDFKDTITIIRILEFVYSGDGLAGRARHALHTAAFVEGRQIES